MNVKQLVSLTGVEKVPKAAGPVKLVDRMPELLAALTKVGHRMFVDA